MHKLIAVVALALASPLCAGEPIAINDTSTQTATTGTVQTTTTAPPVVATPVVPALTLAPIVGTFDPPTLTGPDEMIFRFDVKVVANAQDAERVLKLTPPSGFEIKPSEFPYDARNGLHGEAIIKRGEGSVTGRIVLATIQSARPSSLEPIHSFFSFTYVPLVAVCSYFLYGVAGIALGWVARTLKKMLDASEPAPHQVALANAKKADANQAANAPPPPSQPQRVFWRFWYLADFVVAMIVGVVLMSALMKNGLPPASAGYPLSAFVIGFGMGVFTNTELFTKVHV